LWDLGRGVRLEASAQPDIKCNRVPVLVECNKLVPWTDAVVIGCSLPSGLFAQPGQFGPVPDLPAVGHGPKEHSAGGTRA
jgi:hypothetical protein